MKHITQVSIAKADASDNFAEEVKLMIQTAALDYLGGVISPDKDKDGTSA